jgi:putative Holliday junction resolvase
VSGTQTVLGFDFGTKRIGVAVGQTLTRTVQPLTTLGAVRQGPDWNGIAALVHEWQPARLVVGLPLNMDGSEHAMSEAARHFGVQLKQRYNLPVDFIDERLSSVEAEAQMQALPLRKKQRQAKQTVDMLAAQLILQSWFNQQPMEPSA